MTYRAPGTGITDLPSWVRPYGVRFHNSGTPADALAFFEAVVHYADAALLSAMLHYRELQPGATMWTDAAIAERVEPPPEIPAQAVERVLRTVAGSFYRERGMTLGDFVKVLAVLGRGDTAPLARYLLGTDLEAKVSVEDAGALVALYNAVSGTKKQTIRLGEALRVFVEVRNYLSHGGALPLRVDASVIGEATRAIADQFAQLWVQELYVVKRLRLPVHGRVEATLCRAGDASAPDHKGVPLNTRYEELLVFVDRRVVTGSRESLPEAVPEPFVMLPWLGVTLKPGPNRLGRMFGLVVESGHIRFHVLEGSPNDGLQRVDLGEDTQARCADAVKRDLPEILDEPYARAWRMLREATHMAAVDGVVGPEEWAYLRDLIGRVAAQCGVDAQRLEEDYVRAYLVEQAVEQARRADVSGASRYRRLARLARRFRLDPVAVLERAVRMECIEDPGPLAAVLGALRERARVWHRAELERTYGATEQTFKALEAFREDPPEVWASADRTRWVGVEGLAAQVASAVLDGGEGRGVSLAQVLDELGWPADAVVMAALTQRLGVHEGLVVRREGGETRVASLRSYVDSVGDRLAASVAWHRLRDLVDDAAGDLPERVLDALRRSLGPACVTWQDETGETWVAYAAAPERLLRGLVALAGGVLEAGHVDARLRAPSSWSVRVVLDSLVRKGLLERRTTRDDDIAYALPAALEDAIATLVEGAGGTLETSVEALTEELVISRDAVEQALEGLANGEQLCVEREGERVRLSTGRSRLAPEEVLGRYIAEHAEGWVRVADVLEKAGLRGAKAKSLGQLLPKAIAEGRVRGVVKRHKAPARQYASEAWIEGRIVDCVTGAAGAPVTLRDLGAAVGLDPEEDSQREALECLVERLVEKKGWAIQRDAGGGVLSVASEDDADLDRDRDEEGRGKAAGGGDESGARGERPNTGGSEGVGEREDDGESGEDEGETGEQEGKTSEDGGESGEDGGESGEDSGGGSQGGDEDVPPPVEVLGRYIAEHAEGWVRVADVLRPAKLGEASARSLGKLLPRAIEDGRVEGVVMRRKGPARQYASERWLRNRIVTCLEKAGEEGLRKPQIADSIGLPWDVEALRRHVNRLIGELRTAGRIEDFGHGKGKRYRLA